MLNFDVKRKINTLRDILVGKVPDPKAQVEQITIALIYKFMDDMDLAGAEFGGKRVFFAGDYEKYAFTQIMLPEHSAQDRLNMYAEGIDKMVNNAELPSLFRDILRGAYIPYRDPDTLNRFLKEIAEFSYDNSEDLGNAFEYLLSIMGSQGDAGQFRTPRHIIDMMVEIVAPRKDETILDPACGTAGFLISAYKYIDAQNRDAEGKSTLSGEDKKRMAQNFAGYDISPDMVRLSRVNMYLHGFSNPQISEYDTLTSLEKWDDNYDVILANPPFMTPKGGIVPHTRYEVTAKRAEVLFVDYIAEHLNPTGRAAIIVPEGVVFQSQTAYKKLRKMLIEDDYLYAVVSLPAGVFNPYSGVKTSILFLDKTIAKQKEEVLFVKMVNDGFDLGAQRREIKQNDIPDIISAFKAYKSGEDIRNLSFVTLANKRTIAMQDYVLMGERYQASRKTDSRWEMVELGEVLSYEQPTKYIVDSVDYDDAYKTPVLTAGQTFILGYTNETEGIYKQNLPVIIFDDFTTATQFVDFPFKVKSSAMKILKNDPQQTNIKFLYYAMKNIRFEHSTHKRYWIAEYSKVRIPLPPLSVQNEIVKEIEAYQKIIDGAQQIIDNYKPVVKGASDWERVKLGKIAKFKYGYTDTAKDEGGARFVRITDIETSGILADKNAKYIDLSEKSKEYLLEQGDIIVARTGATYGKTAIFTADYPAVYASFLIKIELPTERILNEYYWIFAQSNEYWKQANSLVSGGAQPQFNANAIAEIEVPIPPLDVQQEIVDRAKEEMKIVSQNKRLIEIFEQKIADRIAEVWGE